MHWVIFEVPSSVKFLWVAGLPEGARSVADK